MGNDPSNIGLSEEDKAELQASIEHNKACIQRMEMKEQAHRTLNDTSRNIGLPSLNDLPSPNMGNLQLAPFHTMPRPTTQMQSELFSPTPNDPIPTTDAMIDPPTITWSRFDPKSGKATNIAMASSLAQSNPNLSHRDSDNSTVAPLTTWTAINAMPPPSADIASSSPNSANRNVNSGFECELCADDGRHKTFTSSSSLYNHLRGPHSLVLDIRQKNSKLYQPMPATSQGRPVRFERAMPPAFIAAYYPKENDGDASLAPNGIDRAQSNDMMDMTDDAPQNANLPAHSVDQIQASNSPQLQTLQGLSDHDLVSVVCKRSLANIATQLQSTTNLYATSRDLHSRLFGIVSKLAHHHSMKMFVQSINDQRAANGVQHRLVLTALGIEEF